MSMCDHMVHLSQGLTCGKHLQAINMRKVVKLQRAGLVPFDSICHIGPPYERYVINRRVHVPPNRRWTKDN